MRGRGEDLLGENSNGALARKRQVDAIPRNTNTMRKGLMLI